MVVVVAFVGDDEKNDEKNDNGVVVVVVVVDTYQSCRSKGSSGYQRKTRQRNQALGERSCGRP